jgi:membrane-bound lytic murein transglycosylase MltF
MDAHDRYDSLIQWYWALAEQRSGGFDAGSWGLVKAQVKAESNFDPYAVSPAGAAGLLQLMPDTARGHGLLVDGERDDRYNPEKCLDIGIRELIHLWGEFQAERGLERWRFALAAYDAGLGNILKAQELARAAGMPTDSWASVAVQLPRVTGDHAEETIDYVRRILADYTARAGGEETT